MARKNREGKVNELNLTKWPFSLYPFNVTWKGKGAGNKADNKNKQTCNKVWMTNKQQLFNSEPWKQKQFQLWSTQENQKKCFPQPKSIIRTRLFRTADKFFIPNDSHLLLLLSSIYLHLFFILVKHFTNHSKYQNVSPTSCSAWKHGQK